MIVQRPKYLTFEVGQYPKPEDFDLVEIKSDGWFSALVLEGTEWRLFSNSSRLIKEGKLGRSIERTVLYGEYIYGTEWAKDHPDIYGRIFVFGADMIEGKDLKDVTHSAGRELIAQFLDKYFDQEPIMICNLVETYPISDAPEVWEMRVLPEKLEGLIFKKSSAPWGSPFARMKFATTMDYVVMDFEDSDSDSYAGRGVAAIVGGLFVNGELVKKCKISGLTEEMRVEFYNNPEKYIGKVLEAHGKKLSKRGALRHPNFNRWREDKLPEQCTWES